MGGWRAAVRAGMLVVSVLLVALHSPGQLSVDSGVALYEGAVGHAVGWGPTFFAATLQWLGGGELGASFFVALNTLAIYGCLAALLGAWDEREPAPARWRRAAALVLALNPLFAFYAGIVWKDVMLSTCAMVAATALLTASGAEGRARGWRIALALLAVAPLTLLRQQGVLLAMPLVAAAAWVAAVPSLRSRSRGRALGLAIAIVASSAATTVLLQGLSSRTIRPAQSSPVAVGVDTIRSYDIAGMIAYARPGDLSPWSGADAVMRQQLRYYYDPERIDPIWNDPVSRAYFRGLGSETLARVWWAGLRADPMAYASHRARAFAALMGFGSVAGCVPAYWGVAAPPQYLEPLGLVEAMDARDHAIGRMTEALYPTPVFRHWIYASLLAIACVAALRRRRRDRAVLLTTVGAAAAYLLSYAPTTIACDFRYLYPVACLSTVSCIWLLLRPGTRNQTPMSEGSNRSSGSSASEPA